MSITVVGELVVGSREFLEALIGYGVEIATELSVLSKHNISTRHEGVDQRFLAHFDETN